MRRAGWPFGCFERWRIDCAPTRQRWLRPARQKKNVYRRNGVLEYVVWRVHDGAVDWFVLEDGEYVTLTPDAAGVVESRRFPGLRLAAGALLAGEVAAVLAELRRGLDSPAHAAFSAGLAESRD